MALRIFQQARPLSLKLLIVLELLLLVTIITMLIPVRAQMLEQIEADLRGKLMSIAAVASLQLSGDEIAMIRTAADVASPQFQRQRLILTEIRDSASLTQDHIYTLYRNPNEPDLVRFGVMTHPMPFVGDPLKLLPHLQFAFEQAEAGRVSGTGLYRDEHGEWISAFAPIRDSTGKVVGLLEVDESSQAYFEGYRRTQWITASIALAALGVASGIGYLVINRVVLLPMRAVRGGMQALSKQDFGHKVSLKTRDEFEQLGDLLNDLSRQLNAARRVAQGFMPKSLPSPPGWSIAACTDPCEATAGDYYDVFVLPPAPGETGSPASSPRIAILVADVTGHGLGPSLHMAACRSALRALASTGLRPGKLLATLDAMLQEDLEGGNFITLLYGVLEPDGRFTFCNAGHGPALLHRAARSPATPTPHPVLTLMAHRAPLGVPWEPLEGEPDETTLHLHPGDRILLCSDGVPEAHSPTGELLGETHLHELLIRPDLKPDTLLAEIRASVQTHCKGRNRADDVTILCVDRIDPVPATATAATSMR